MAVIRVKNTDPNTYWIYDYCVDSETGERCHEDGTPGIWVPSNGHTNGGYWLGGSHTNEGMLATKVARKIFNKIKSLSPFNV